MDPNAVLEVIRDRVHSLQELGLDAPPYLLHDLLDSFGYLDGWLSKGGFPPDDWNQL